MVGVGASCGVSNAPGVNGRTIVMVASGKEKVGVEVTVEVTVAVAGRAVAVAVFDGRGVTVGGPTRVVAVGKRVGLAKGVSVRVGVPVGRGVPGVTVGLGVLVGKGVSVGITFVGKRRGVTVRCAPVPPGVPCKPLSTITAPNVTIAEGVGRGLAVLSEGEGSQATRTTRQKRATRDVLNKSKGPAPGRMPGRFPQETLSLSIAEETITYPAHCFHLVKCGKRSEMGWSNHEGVAVKAYPHPQRTLSPCPLSHEGRGGFLPHSIPLSPRGERGLCCWRVYLPSWERGRWGLAPSPSTLYLNSYEVCNT